MPRKETEMMEEFRFGINIKKPSNSRMVLIGIIRRPQDIERILNYFTGPQIIWKSVDEERFERDIFISEIAGYFTDTEVLSKYCKLVSVMMKYPLNEKSLISLVNTIPEPIINAIIAHFHLTLMKIKQI